MKKTILFLSLCMLADLGFAREPDDLNNGAMKLWEEKIEWQQEREPESYKAFTSAFVEIFNSKDLSEILDHCSESLLENADPKKLVGFLEFMKSENGKIETLRFKYFDIGKQRSGNQELAVYSLKFENDTQWEFRVGVNESLKMTRNIITDSNYNEDLPLIRSQAPLTLPFQKGEEWYVLWGGIEQEDNYHVTSRAQKNAIDFIIRHPWSKRSYKTDGKTNADYYAFGKPIYSPSDGEVVKVIDGIEDNIPSKMNPKHLTGNTVIIKTKPQEYILLAHFKENSIKVQEGDNIEAGTLLGACGNSGNSSEPHLHMHSMNAPTMNEATGIKMYFEELIINGESHARNYSPVRGNTVMRK